METDEQHSTPQLQQQYDAALPADMVHDYKLMVKNIAEALNTNDLSKLTYMCDLDNISTETDALNIFRKLERKDEFTYDNVGPLEDILKSIDRCDLVRNHIESYKQKYGHYAGEH